MQSSDFGRPDVHSRSTKAGFQRYAPSNTPTVADFVCLSPFFSAVSFYFAFPWRRSTFPIVRTRLIFCELIIPIHHCCVCTVYCRLFELTMSTGHAGCKLSKLHVLRQIMLCYVFRETTPCALSGPPLARPPVNRLNTAFAAFHEFFNDAMRADSLFMSFNIPVC